MIEDLPTPPEGKIGWPWTQASLPLPAKMPDGSPWPKISIVTPSYNQAQYLEETIRSVLLQNYPNLEYIIIDGGSTDGSVEIIKKYEPWLTYWVSEPDRGQTYAINKGIKHCNSEIFAFINSDDFYYPDTFQEIAQLYHLHGRKPTTWICGRINQVNEQGSILAMRQNRYGTDPLDWYLHRWREKGTSIIQPASFWSFAIFDQVGLFDENFSYSFDYEFFVRLFSLGIKYIDSPGIFTAFRIHSHSKTKSSSTFFVEEDYQIAEKYFEQNHQIDGYQRLLKRGEFLADRARFTRLLLEDKSLLEMLKSIIPLLMRHPQFVFLKRTMRGLLTATFSKRAK